MGTSSEELQLIIKARNEAQATVRQFRESVDQSGESVKKLGVVAGLTAGVTLGLINKLASLPSVVRGLATDFAQTSDKLTNQALAAGLSTKAFQEWAYVGKDVGVTSAKVGEAAYKLTTNLEKGTKGTRAAVAALGLSLKDLRASSPERQLDTIVGALHDVGDANRQAALTAELFGKQSGVLKVIRSDAEALREEARKTGAVLDSDLVARGAKLNQVMEKLGGLMDNMKLRTTDAFIEMAGGAGTLGQTLTSLGSIGVRVAQAISESWAVLRISITAVVGAMFMALEKVAGGLAAIQDKAKYLGAGAKAFADLAGPFKELSALFAGGARDIGAQLESQIDSIGESRGAFNRLRTELDELGKTFEGTADRGRSGGRDLGDTVDELGEKFGNLEARAAKASMAAEDALLKQWADVDKDTAAHTRKMLSDEAKLTEQWAKATDLIYKRHLQIRTQEQRRMLDKSVDDFNEALERQQRSEELRFEAGRMGIKLSTDGIEKMKAAWIRAGGSVATYYDNLDQRIEKAIEDQMRSAEAALDFADALTHIGGEIGGTDGAVMQLGGVAMGVFGDMLSGTRQNITGLEALQAAARGAAAAIGSKDGLSGAISGAQAGSSFGGWGALIGAVVGMGVGSWNKYAASVKRAIAATREMEREVVKLYGSMNEAQKVAEQFGITVRAELGMAPDSTALQEYLDQIQAALDAQQERIEGAKKAFEGLEVLIDKWILAMRKGSRTTHEAQLDFERFGRYAWAAFSTLVIEGGNLIDVLKQMAPVLDKLIQAMAEFGVKATAAMAHLIQLYQVMKRNQDTVDAIQALTTVMDGLGKAVWADKQLVQDFAADISRLFEELLEGGATSEQALLLLQSPLQKLWEAINNGIVDWDDLDEKTKKLLQDAEEAGMVGEQFRDTQEQILRVLIEGLAAIIKAVGGELPDAWQDAIDRMNDYKDAAEDIPGPPGPAPAPGDPGDDSQRRGPRGDGGPPGQARGGFSAHTVLPFTPRAAAGLISNPVPGGQLLRVAEAGEPEVTLPVRTLLGQVSRETAASVVAAMGGRGGGEVAELYIGGDRYEAALRRRQRSGHLRTGTSGVER